MSTIVSFSGDYAFLSNFYPSEVRFGKIMFPTVEHGFQAAKTRDLDQRRRIARLERPAEAKRAGRQLDLRSDWIDVRLSVMYRLVYRKFTRHPDLADRLVDTGKATLVEGNCWNDTFWGVCKGQGENRLGEILMMVREAIQEDD